MSMSHCSYQAQEPPCAFHPVQRAMFVRLLNSLKTKQNQKEHCDTATESRLNWETGAKEAICRRHGK